MLVHLVLLGGVARAEDARVSEARLRFSEGTELVRRAQWAEALAAFEGSARIRPHVITTYNIAACHRALGRYTLARRLLRQALAAQEPATGKLPDALREDAAVLIAEIDRLLVQLDVDVRPADASFAVDGRPLEPAAPEEAAPGPRSFIAGVAAPGAGHRAPAGRFVLVLDPGVHVLSLQRKGFTDVVVNRSFSPAHRGELVLELDRLPATLHVEATVPGTSVAVDGIDVGLAPIDLSRPAGVYEVVLRHRGYLPYRTRLSVNPGEAAHVDATLLVDKPSVVRRWWFWTSIGVGLTAVALGGYFGARASETPQLDGGGLGWVIRAR